MKNILSSNGIMLKYCSDLIKKDYNAVLLAVKNNDMALEFASDELLAMPSKALCLKKMILLFLLLFKIMDYQFNTPHKI
jgi:hypothetical protein